MNLMFKICFSCVFAGYNTRNNYCYLNHSSYKSQLNGSRGLGASPQGVCSNCRLEVLVASNAFNRLQQVPNVYYRPTNTIPLINGLSEFTTKANTSHFGCFTTPDHQIARLIRRCNPCSSIISAFHYLCGLRNIP